MENVELLIDGHLGADWSEWLEGLTVTHIEAGRTILTGQVTDQSALYGLLNRLSRLGIRLLSFRVADQAPDE